MAAELCGVSKTTISRFLNGKYENMSAETREHIRQVIAEVDYRPNRSAQRLKASRSIVFKVILETGLLVSPERIAEASFMAMEEGADFIKTSTGKVSVNATPVAASVMCECIKKFYEKTGRKVGFKAAGGTSTARKKTTPWARLR